MCVCVCVCTCVCACMHVCVRVCTCVCTCARSVLLVCEHICMCLHIGHTVVPLSESNITSPNTRKVTLESSEETACSKLLMGFLSPTNICYPRAKGSPTLRFHNHITVLTIHLTHCISTLTHDWVGTFHILTFWRCAFLNPKCVHDIIYEINSLYTI